jgi:hypothetical protein
MTQALGLVGAPNHNGSAQNTGAVYAFDVSLPTPVRLLHFAARREGGTAVLEWEITEADGLAGFHVHRQEGDDKRLRQTETLLGGGTRYHFVDPEAPPGPAAYWLRELSRAGDTAWHGPVTLPPTGSLPALAVGYPPSQPLLRGHPHGLHVDPGRARGGGGVRSPGALLPSG